MPMRADGTMRAVLGGVALAATALLAASCRPADESLRPPLPPPVVNGVSATPLSDLPGRRGDARRALVVRHRVISVQLPLGAASETEDLWSYVNEEPAGSRRGPCLARNGMRVGLGREADWPEIARILRRLTGQRLARARMIAKPGDPLSISLKKGQDTQPIFMFRPDGTLFGNDYPPGDYLMVLTAGIDFDNPRTVLISGAPVIRSRYRRRQYVKGHAGYMLTSNPVYYRLEDMAFQFNVPPGGFLMIGPGPEVARSSSPGSRFLVKSKQGERFETLLVIAPEVFSVRVRVVD